MPKQAIQQAGENHSMEGALEALGKSIARWTDTPDRLVTAIPGLSLFRRDAPTPPISGLYEPSICLIAQGAKRVLLGDDTFVYDAHHFLLTSVHLPTVVQIINASREKPCLGLMVKLDQREMAQLMVDSNLPPPRAQQSSRSMATGEVTLPLLSACQRLLDLLAEPQDMPILAPIIQREIMYRLLVGDQGARLRQMASAGSQSHQLARAIDWLQGNFTRPLQIDDLAAQVRMSSSTFHHHFRSMTALSPLQFQKQLRLHEARQLMLTEHLDAAPRRSKSAIRVLPSSAASTAACLAHRRGAISRACVNWRRVREPRRCWDWRGNGQGRHVLYLIALERIVAIMMPKGKFPLSESTGNFSCSGANIGQKNSQFYRKVPGPKLETAIRAVLKRPNDVLSQVPFH